MHPTNNPNLSTPFRRKREEHWIRQLGTIQEGVKIQQCDKNSPAKEGHNSTKNPLNIDPGSVFTWGGGGVKILSYTGLTSIYMAKTFSTSSLEPLNETQQGKRIQSNDNL